MTNSLNFDDQKNAQALLEAIQFFAAKGWCPATSTNHSVRLSGSDRILISRSGVDKSVFQKDDLVVINGEGKLVSPAPGVKPSAETEIHTALYRRFPDINCILHTHSKLGTWLSKTKSSPLKFSGWEILKGFAGNMTHQMDELLPIVPNSQEMPDIVRAMENNWAQKPHGFLIAGHGLYSWGTSVAEAKRHIETWEFLFEVSTLEK